MQFEKVDPPYNEHLSASEIADGITLALANARRLLEDAQLLLKNCRWASATALAILAIEERHKESILQELATVKKGEPTKPLWNRYRNHLSKNQKWILPLLSKAHPTASIQTLIQQAEDPDSLHSKNLDELKQACIYTDRRVSRPAYWITPLQVEEEQAQKMVLIAEALVGPPYVVTEQQILEMQALVADEKTDKEAIENFLLKNDWWDGTYRLWDDDDHPI